MKKLYILAAAALMVSASASAKSFTVYAGENVVTNGQEVTEYKAEIFDLNEYGVPEVSYTYDPEFSVISDTAASMEVTATSTCSYPIALCFGGNCMTDMSITKTNMMEANKKVDLKFDAAGSVTTLAELPVITADLTVMYVGEEDSKVGFSVVMGKNAGVEVVKFDPSFRVGNGVINYDLNGSAVASIYSINGAEVVRAEISGQGTISTADLPAGIYVYRLQGAKNIAGKLIVK